MRGGNESRSPSAKRVPGISRALSRRSSTSTCFSRATCERQTTQSRSASNVCSEPTRRVPKNSRRWRTERASRASSSGLYRLARKRGEWDNKSGGVASGYSMDALRTSSITYSVAKGKPTGHTVVTLQMVPGANNGPLEGSPGKLSGFSRRPAWPACAKTRQVLVALSAHRVPGELREAIIDLAAGQAARKWQACFVRLLLATPPYFPGIANPRPRAPARGCGRSSS